MPGKRFDYVSYTDKSQELSNQFKRICLTMEGGMELLNPSREKSLAIAKLEECFMWLGKAIKVDQERDKDTAWSY